MNENNTCWIIKLYLWLTLLKNSMKNFKGLQIMF